MKRTLLLILSMVVAIISFAETNLSSYKGVWASDNAEAVITDSVCIVYAKMDSTMQAVLEIPSSGIYHQTTFAKDGSVSFSTPTPLEINLTDGKLNIFGNQLKKVEDVDIVAPYGMAQCKSKFDVGKCLQEWRLGVKYGMQDDMPYCEINTNRHMFVYMVYPSMVYIRAAATRNNNNGTLFFQNVRMMKNQNTGEYTMSIYPNNFNIAQNDLEIDNTKFQPNACTFNPDGGIYWSLISFTSDKIAINGCGETYYVDRTPIDAPLREWIKFAPYSKGIVDL